MKLLPKQQRNEERNREMPAKGMCVSASEMGAQELITNIQHLISHTIGVICHPSPCSLAMLMILMLAALVSVALVRCCQSANLFWILWKSFSVRFSCYYFSERIKIHIKMPGWKIARARARARFSKPKKHTTNRENKFTFFNTTEEWRKKTLFKCRARKIWWNMRVYKISLGPFVQFHIVSTDGNWNYG